MPSSYEPDDAIREQARQWLVRLRSGEATEADAAEFARWRAQSPAHAQAAQELGRIWRNLRAAAANVATETPLPEHAGIRNLPQRAIKPGRRAFIGGAIAAGAAWLMVRPPLHLWPSVSELAADYHTGTGEQRQLALSEGLQIQMNTQTRINLRTDIEATTAVELLTGEAEVRADGSEVYTVLAGGARVHARTARFNIRYTGPDVQVCCLEGIVELDHPQQRTTLAASQQLRYDNHSIQSIASVDPDEVMAWRRGLLLFDDTPLSQVVEEINRYRRGKIIIHNQELARHRVQAQFSIHDLDAALVLIRDLYGARINRLPGEIVLLS